MTGLRVVVTGLAVTYPFGGVFWDYVQYVLGFLRLGHDALYLEDTGQWAYEPEGATFVESGAESARLFADRLSQLDPRLADRWFYRDSNGGCYGKSGEDAARFCRTADLFVHLSASCRMRDEYMDAQRLVFIDSDPMYTQQALTLPHHELNEREKEFVARLGRHSRLCTFGENVGRPGCLIPQGSFHWLPTRQPIVLDVFRGAEVPVRRRRQVLTTVASWEPAQAGPVVGSVKYYGKSFEFRRFMDLPARLPLPVELAMSGRAPFDELAAHGWAIKDPLAVSRDPGVYQNYLAHSFGELSVAKNAYVASRSGWFSCRTACYLALGVPAVVQETGFSENIPCGEGLFAFSTADDAQAAVEALVSAPERHAAAALDIAATYFDSNRVLSRLIEDAFAVPAAAAGVHQGGSVR